MKIWARGSASLDNLSEVICEPIREAGDPTPHFWGVTQSLIKIKTHKYFTFHIIHHPLNFSYHELFLNFTTIENYCIFCIVQIFNYSCGNYFQSIWCHPFPPTFTKQSRFTKVQKTQPKIHHVHVGICCLPIWFCQVLLQFMFFHCGGTKKKTLIC